MTSKTIGGTALVLLLIGIPAAARSAEAPASHEEEAEHVATPPAPYGQWLVDRAVAAHPAVKSVELAVALDGVCRTVAATAKEDVGERCDRDETGPMKSGRASVEAPSKEDPVYDVTLPLHDAGGHLIGAVGMDIDPAGLDRSEVLKLARQVLAGIETGIPSKGRLFEASPDQGVGQDR
jgi:hypothetical protein